MYTLLTTSADNIPDFYASGMNVTISDNFQNLLEEMPASEAYNMGIGVGIIGGIMIGIFLCLLLVTVVYFLRKENNEDVENNETESENKPISNKNNDAKIISVNNKNIDEKDYPLLFEVYLIYREDNTNENISKIVNWIETEEGQEFIKNIK